MKGDPIKFTPPSWLTPRAHEIFVETAGILGDQGLPSDTSILADYAQAQADCEDWAVAVRFQGECIASERTGSIYTNPMYHNLMNRRKDLERYRLDLGMTPRSRGVIVKNTKKNGLKDAMKP